MQHLFWWWGCGRLWQVSVISLDKSCQVILIPWHTALAGHAARYVIIYTLLLDCRLHTAATCVRVCVCPPPSPAVNQPIHGKAVGRYAGECCQNVGSWRDLRQVL